MNRQRLDPSWLPPGTVVGPWMLKGFHAAGACGLVFRAVRARRQHGGLVALKFALRPHDPRFLREAELLGRIRHPSVPELLGASEYQPPGGAAYPYLAMEWVEGMPLYEWAERYRPTSRQVCRVLAQLARGLEATHAAGGVHRDVKGANLLVNPDRLTAHLTDFGACHYEGAERLTREGLPPGTEDYRSPEALDFELHRGHHTTEVYTATPADDVFALGVSAWRLVTGRYLPPVRVREEARGPGTLEFPTLPPLKELNPRVEESLSALLPQALVERMEERPSAGALAEALEQTGLQQTLELDKPLSALEPVPAHAPAPAQVPKRTRRGLPRWTSHVACILLGGLLMAAAGGWMISVGKARLFLDGEGDTGLADTRLSVTQARQDSAAEVNKLGQPIPEEPLPTQRRAPHCLPPPMEVIINDGCWIEVRTAKPPCPNPSYEWKGSCYLPDLSPPKKPTSQPPP